MMSQTFWSHALGCARCYKTGIHDPCPEGHALRQRELLTRTPPGQYERPTPDAPGQALFDFERVK
jgi:hypothetical protein